MLQEVEKPRIRFSPWPTKFLKFFEIMYMTIILKLSTYHNTLVLGLIYKFLHYISGGLRVKYGFFLKNHQHHNQNILTEPTLT